MSQLKCGSLVAVVNDPRMKFRGRIMLGSRINADIQLSDNPRAKAESQAPDYDVNVAPSGTTPARNIGAAWLKNSERSNGGDFLSMMLDDPDWPAPVNVTAFPPDTKDGEWRIVWSRPRGERVAVAA